MTKLKPSANLNSNHHIQQDKHKAKKLLLNLSALIDIPVSVHETCRVTISTKKEVKKIKEILI